MGIKIFFSLTNLYHLEPEDGAEFANLGGDVSQADGTVMGRTLAAPGLDEIFNAEREFVAAVCVSNLKDWARNRFSLSHEELQLSVSRLGDGKQSHRSVLDFHLH